MVESASSLMIFKSRLSMAVFMFISIGQYFLIMLEKIPHNEVYQLFFFVFFSQSESE